jgi:hypothetical protein
MTGFTIQTHALFTIGNNFQDILRIETNGDIYYRKDNEMKKVNIPDEISEAFQMTILGYTGNNPEDAIVEKISQNVQMNIL